MQLRLPDGALSGHFVFALTLPDTVLLVGLALFFLRAHHESPRDVLFGWRRPGGRLLLGIALIPLSFFVVVTVLLMVQVIAAGAAQRAAQPAAGPGAHTAGRDRLRACRHDRRRRARGDSARLRAAPVRAVSRRRRWRASSCSARSSGSATSSRATTSRWPRRSSARSGARSSCARRSILGPMVGHAGLQPRAGREVPDAGGLGSAADKIARIAVMLAHRCWPVDGASGCWSACSRCRCRPSPRGSTRRTKCSTSPTCARSGSTTTCRSRTSTSISTISGIVRNRRVPRDVPRARRPRPAGGSTSARSAARSCGRRSTPSAI